MEPLVLTIGGRWRLRNAEALCIPQAVNARPITAARSIGLPDRGYARRYGRRRDRYRLADQRVAPPSSRRRDRRRTASRERYRRYRKSVFVAAATTRG